jgi:hypothetical protein
MKNNRGKVDMLRRIQQEINNVTPNVYSAIAIGLVEEYNFTAEDVSNLFVYTQSLWAECAKKNISMRQWCLELTNIDVQPFVSEKAKAGGNNNENEM